MIRFKHGNTNVKDGVFTKVQIESYIELKQEKPVRYRMTPHPVKFDMYYTNGPMN